MPDTKRVRLFLTLKKYGVIPVTEAYSVGDLLLVHQLGEETGYKSEYYLYERNECTFVVHEEI